MPKTRDRTIVRKPDNKKASILRKRLKGLIKKAKDLNILTGVHTSVIVFDEDKDKTCTYGTGIFKALGKSDQLKRFLKEHKSK